MADDMRAFGASETQVSEALAAKSVKAESDVQVVYADNVDAVRLFVAMGSQWRTASLSTMGKAVIRRTGLDYSVLDVTAALAGVPTPVAPETFERLQVMEGAATKAWLAAEAQAK